MIIFIGFDENIFRFTLQDYFQRQCSRRNRPRRKNQEMAVCPMFVYYIFLVWVRVKDFRCGSLHAEYSIKNSEKVLRNERSIEKMRSIALLTKTKPTVPPSPSFEVDQQMLADLIALKFDGKDAERALKVSVSLVFMVFILSLFLLCKSKNTLNNFYSIQIAENTERP